ncbi:hypothetical protein T439DRAFT_380676 [Meredithblackwellia eburnea MCA 4105]
MLFPPTPTGSPFLTMYNVTMQNYNNSRRAGHPQQQGQDGTPFDFAHHARALVDNEDVGMEIPPITRTTLNPPAPPPQSSSLSLGDRISPTSPSPPLPRSPPHPLPPSRSQLPLQPFPKLPSLSSLHLPGLGAPPPLLPTPADDSYNNPFDPAPQHTVARRASYQSVLPNNTRRIPGRRSFSIKESYPVSASKTLRRDPKHKGVCDCCQQAATRHGPNGKNTLCSNCGLSWLRKVKALSGKGLSGGDLEVALSDFVETRVKFLAYKRARERTISTCSNSTNTSTSTGGAASHSDSGEHGDDEDWSTSPTFEQHRSDAEAENPEEESNQNPSWSYPLSLPTTVAASSPASGHHVPSIQYPFQHYRDPRSSHLEQREHDPLSPISPLSEEASFTPPVFFPQFNHLHPSHSYYRRPSASGMSTASSSTGLSLSRSSSISDLRFAAPSPSYTGSSSENDAEWESSDFAVVRNGTEALLSKERTITNHHHHYHRFRE